MFRYYIEFFFCSPIRNIWSLSRYIICTKFVVIVCSCFSPNACRCDETFRRLMILPTFRHGSFISIATRILLRYFAILLKYRSVDTHIQTHSDSTRLFLHIYMSTHRKHVYKYMISFYTRIHFA